MVNISSAVFDRSAPDLDSCPDESLPEFAFIGRSNVGKSSLLNMLAGQGGLARVSPTPGFTKLINFFTMSKRWRLVDLPGYGFAQVARQDSARFNQAVAGYLQHRPNLVCAFALIDSGLRPQKIDLEFVEWLVDNSVPFVLVFTKTDRTKPVQVQANIKAFTDRIADWCENLPQIFTCSATTGQGRAELLGMIDGALPETRVEPDASASNLAGNPDTGEDVPIARVRGEKVAPNSTGIRFQSMVGFMRNRRQAGALVAFLAAIWMFGGTADRPMPVAFGHYETLTVAGGCFWGLQETLRRIPGVIKTRVGYTGGPTPDPTYELVAAGQTGHSEAVEVIFDPARVRFDELVAGFLTAPIPSRPSMRVGSLARSAIFYHNEEQQRAATRVKESLNRSAENGSPLVASVIPATAFFPAEEYHQDYYRKISSNASCRAEDR